MKETLVSNCEKKFILQAFGENLRLDKRTLQQYRDAKITFGTDWGCCHVTLGQTRVLTQVSCEIETPKLSKANEGVLQMNVEISPMAAPHLELNRQSDLSVKVNRLLEKCFKESACIDLEALCVVAEEKVWKVRVDMNVMNADGNIAGCCSVAALAALAHFRHPDVTSTGDSLIIHSFSDREPIPLTLHHYPVIITYAVFNSGQQVVSDPTSLEERTSDSLLWLCMNGYRELCGIYLEGKPLPHTDILLSCSHQAASTADQFVKMVKSALADDLIERKKKRTTGLASCLVLDQVLASVQQNLKIEIEKEEISEHSVTQITQDKVKMEVDESDEKTGSSSDSESDISNATSIDTVDVQDNKYKLINVREKTAELVNVDQDAAENKNDSDDDVTIENVIDRSKNYDEIVLSGESEEEDVPML